MGEAELQPITIQLWKPISKAASLVTARFKQARLVLLSGVRISARVIEVETCADVEFLVLGFLSSHLTFDYPHLLPRTRILQW